MKIGIIYYSETGHTLQACEMVKNNLINEGHSVDIKAVTVVDIKTNKTLKDIPSVEGYDLIIFGSPVQGFSLPVPMSEYLKIIKLPMYQKVGILITQYFKLSFMGANHAKRQLLEKIAISQPNLYAYSVVHWSSRRRVEQLNKAVEKLSFVE